MFAVAMTLTLFYISSGGLHFCKFLTLFEQNKQREAGWIQ